MTLKRKSGGSLVDAANVQRRAGSGWTNVATVKRRAAGAWVTVWTGLTVTKASDVVSSVFQAEPAPTQKAMSAAASMTVTGATTYTVAWTFVSGTTFTLSNSAALNPTFSKSVNKNTSVSGVYRCTVTANGMTATADVTVTFTYTTDL